MNVRVLVAGVMVSMVAGCVLSTSGDGEGEGEGVGPTCKLTVLTPAPHPLGATVGLSAGGSLASTLDNTITDFTWSLLEESDDGAEFNGIGGSATLRSTTAGTFVIGLTVTDDTGATSSLCQASVTIE